MPKNRRKYAAEWKIAQRLYFSQENSKHSSRPAVRVALGGIILGVLVMIVAISVVVGFKQEITNKIAGFGSHIQIVNFDNNSTYELQPVRISDSLLTTLNDLAHVEVVSCFASKPGIVKTDSAFQGIVFKGTDYWDYFAQNLVAGCLPEKPNEVLISEDLALSLSLTLDDPILCYFIEEDLRVRRFYISGLYRTCMTEMDKLFVLGDIEVVRRLNGWEQNQVSGIEVLVEDLHHLEEVSDAVYFATANRLDEDGNAFYTQNLQQLNPQIFGWLELLDMNVIIILVLMIIVSSFTLISALLMIILERIRMVGVLKSLGCSNGMIRKIFIYLTGKLIIRAIIIGNVLGLGLALIQKYFHIIKLSSESYYMSYVPIEIDATALLLLNLGIVVMSYIALIGPSHIVSTIKPTTTMKFD